MRTTYCFLWALMVGFGLAMTAADAATITVNNSADTDVDGDGCTLREAIQNANGDDASGSVDCATGTGADTIVFAPAVTAIPLSSPLPDVTDGDTTTIDGGGRVTVDGAGTVRGFTIATAASATFRDLAVTSAKSFQGGGFANHGALHLVRCTLSNNTAMFGGGVYNDNSGTLTVDDSTLLDNRANGTGGGIYSLGTLTVLGSTLSGNEGFQGAGGILNLGAMTVANSTFATNHATASFAQGGGFATSGTATLINVTLSGNSAALKGDAVAYFAGASSALTLANTIVAGAATQNCSGDPFTDGGGNLDDGSSCGFALGNGSYPATPAGLGSLGANGGPTATFGLLAGSAAVDRGLQSICDAAPVGNRDQRGQLRPWDGDGTAPARCDIGAFELAPSVTAIPTLSQWGGLLLALVLCAAGLRQLRP